MNYLSVCSGIEAASVAWHHLGWKPLGISEIEKLPSQVLEHHYPMIPNFGDMTKYKEWSINEPVNLLVGGTPCQAFSVAGLRAGIADPRGNLALTYVGLLDHFRPQWFIWENVPGVLSSNKGADFSAFLSAVVQCGYGFAYRVLDAQYVGGSGAVPQRRRRVFVVGCLGGWEHSAKVLFERESLFRNTKASRKKGEVTPTLSASGTGTSRVGFNCEDEWFIPTTVGTLDTECGGQRRAHQSVMSGHFIPTFWNGTQTADTLTCTSDDQRMPDKNRFQAIIAFEPGIAKREGNSSRFVENISPTLRAEMGDNQVAIAIQDTSGRDKAQNGKGWSEGVSYTLDATGLQGVAIGFDAYNSAVTGDISKTLDTGSDYHHVPNIYRTIAPTLTTNNPSRSPQASEVTQQINAVHQASMAVRRLTPTECERLQGFPDGYTDIMLNGKQTPDGPRYKALGNSMAVNVMKWIGERINSYESSR